MDEKLRKLFNISADEPVRKTEHTPLVLYPSQNFDEDLNYHRPYIKYIAGTLAASPIMATAFNYQSGFLLVTSLIAGAFAYRLCKLNETNNLQSIHCTDSQMVVVTREPENRDEGGLIPSLSETRFDFDSLEIKRDIISANNVPYEV